MRRLSDTEYAHVTDAEALRRFHEVPQDLPLNQWTLLAAVAMVGVTLLLCSVWPMGFAS